MVVVMSFILHQDGKGVNGKIVGNIMRIGKTSVRIGVGGGSWMWVLVLKTGIMDLWEEQSLGI
jgi:hypothetical protein